LCFGFEHITITFLLRRIRRQLIHIFRTDGRTFIAFKICSFDYCDPTMCVIKFILHFFVVLNFAFAEVCI